MKTLNKHLSLNEMANTCYKWAILAFDETENWNDDIKNRAKFIQGVYLVNLKEPTHLCELAISFPAVWIRNVIPFRDAVQNFTEDELSEIERDNGGENFCYVSGKSTARLIKYHRSGKEENILEDEMCNPTYHS